MALEASKKLHSWVTRLGRVAFPEALFRLNSSEKALFLTFDDGPTPEVTPWVLEVLRHYNAPSTFFLIGKNAVQNPELVNQIKSEGHVLGGHCMKHENGWKTSNEAYVESAIKSCEMLETNWFRPPYGRLKRNQYAELQAKGITTVMWDCLSYDFELQVDGKWCFEHTVANAREGGIVVFHDSLKAEKRLKNCLPLLLETWQEEGFVFRPLFK